MSKGPYNEMQPIIDRMEESDDGQEWTADSYMDYLSRMDDLGIDVD